MKSDLAPVSSGVPQSTVLGHWLFSLYINDIATYTKCNESEIRLFADDCVCYRLIKETEDTVKLQNDIERLTRSIGKEMGYEISTHQIQYNAADKDTDQ